MTSGRLRSVVTWWDVAALLLLAVLAMFYVFNLTGWMIYDDEGEYLYQVWRMSEGEQPYQDFLTPQLPVFLYSGLAIMKLAGPSLLAMRLYSVCIAFASAILLYVAGRKHHSALSGLAGMSIFLLHSDVFRETRVFRNEPLFLLLVTGGLVIGTWTVGHGRRRNIAIAGALFGLATMTKLFGLLPAIGIALWLLWEWWQARKPLRELFLDAVSLAVPLFGVLVLFVVLFSIAAPDFFDMVVSHHVAQGSELAISEVVVNKIGLYWRYLKLYPLFLLTSIVSAVLGFVRQDVRVRWAWQLATAVGFFALSRELGQRHFMYLLPSLSLLTGWLLASALSMTYGWWGRLAAVAALALIIYPWTQRNIDRASWVDRETEQVVAVIEEESDDGAAILSDDIGLAFYSRRPTTFSGAALSHGAVTSGQITGAMLIEEIVGDDVEMVIVDESLLTGNHMVFLRDYPRFHRFLEGNFDYEGSIRRDYQELAIWIRETDQPWSTGDAIHMQYEDGTRFGETIRLLGYSLDSTELAPGDEVRLTLYWESTGPAENYWSVFTHLVSDNGELVAQHDKVPYDGLYPPNRWWPGEIIDDDYRILIPDGLAPGEYYLTVGMYDHLSGERLSLSAADGKPIEGSQITLSQAIRVMSK